MPVTGWTADGWTGSVNLFVELGLPEPGSTLASWDTGLWDTALWGPDAVWTDVSAYARLIRTNRGVAPESNQYNTGTCTILLDNADLRFTEENASGPYFGKIGAGIPVRVRAEVTLSFGVALAMPIFVGRVDEWEDDYPKVGNGSTVTIAASDVFEQFAAFDGFEQTPQGAGETTGRRINRILDNAGYTGPRNIDTGDVTVQATTLAGNALTELRLTADSEGGRLWCEADGSVTFSSRYALVQKVNSYTPSAIFSDTGTTRLLYSQPAFSSSRRSLRNIAAYARKGSTQQVATNEISRALNGDRRLSRTDLVNTDDPSVLSLAQRDVALRSLIERRIDGLTFEPMIQQSPALVDTALLFLADLELWWQVQVIRTPTPALTITRNVFVTGVSHEITPPFNWRVGLSFQSATVWNTVAASTWDDFFPPGVYFPAALGFRPIVNSPAEWDTGVWAW